jgi:C-terminal processing protease CtpA/Prc
MLAIKSTHMLKSSLSNTVIKYCFVLSIALKHQQVLKCDSTSALDTLADKVGLRKGDRVVQINGTFTSNLNNEELRKLMRSRLQMNSINLRVLRKQKREAREDHKTNGK